MAFESHRYFESMLYVAVILRQVAIRSSRGRYEGLRFVVEVSCATARLWCKAAMAA